MDQHILEEAVDLVLIEWLDSKGGAGEWEFVDSLEPLEPVTCTSVGFLIEEKDNYKTIAPTVGGGQVLGRITIPSCSIVKVKTLDNERFFFVFLLSGRCVRADPATLLTFLDVFLLLRSLEATLPTLLDVFSFFAIV